LSPLQSTVSNLGDLFAAGCVAAVVALWCWAKLNRLLAAVFAACFVGAVGAAIALKMIAATYAPSLADAGRFALSQGAPSGHAACATVVYGAAGLLFFRAGRGPVERAGLIYCLAVIAAVCITRITLRTHTMGDVAAGVAVSLAFLALFDRALHVQLRPATAVSMAPLLSAMMVAALLALASGVRITSERLL